MGMVMETAVLAVLVAAEAGLSPEDIAITWDVDEGAVRQRLSELKEKGHVTVRDGVYFAAKGAKPTIEYRGGSKATVNYE